MPIYEYKCKDCGTVTEKLVNHSEPEDEKLFQECSHCGEVAGRIPSLATFELKGDWFKTKGKY